MLWLPSLYLGPNWIRHDGQVQTVAGPGPDRSARVRSSSAATAAAGSSVSGPVPAGGPAQVSGLTSILRISDAIFEPLAARQVVDARRAGIQVATNDALLGVAEAYLDLQRAAGRLAIAREAATNAETLASLTASYARSGAGLEADHRRSLAERDRQRKNVEQAVGELEVASAELVRRIRLDPRLVVAPVEPPETVLRLVPDGCPIDDLIVDRAQAAAPSWPRPRPWSRRRSSGSSRRSSGPSSRASPSATRAAGSAAASNGFFGNFDGRSDADVNLYWEVQNLGFADRAIAKQRAAQQRTATLELMKVQDRVASEVVRAEKERIAAVEADGARRPGRARGPGVARPEPHEHPPGGGPPRGDPPHRGAPARSRPSPRPGPTTSTPSSPTTGPSSASIVPWEAPPRSGKLRRHPAPLPRAEAHPFGPPAARAEASHRACSASPLDSWTQVH